MSGANLLPSRPPIRGYATRYKEMMEALQFSYLRAVAASAGCIVSKPDIDDGIDVQLSHQSESHNGDQVARLEVQMKATSRSAEKRSDYVAATMSRKRWNYYSTENPTINKIVVVMSLPRNQAQWTMAQHDSFSIYYCAYWVNLSGAPTPSNGVENPTVKAPKSQIFDDVALCDMMERIGLGDRP